MTTYTGFVKAIAKDVGEITRKRVAAAACEGARWEAPFTPVRDIEPCAYILWVCAHSSPRSVREWYHCKHGTIYN